MIGMSLVVRMVGHAALLPALDPTYGMPSCTRSAIARSIPLSCSARASRNELPPPTNTASLSASTCVGSVPSCTPCTVQPIGSIAARKVAV